MAEKKESAASKFTRRFAARLITRLLMKKYKISSGIIAQRTRPKKNEVVVMGVVRHPKFACYMYAAGYGITDLINIVEHKK